MKKLIGLFIAAFAFSASMAQTTAQDWTKTDCAGKSHHLFAELDSGNVVVLEYVMMGCASCVTAGNALKTITNPYKTSHPGRVRVYSIGYTNTYTCTQMQNWQTANNFTHPVFTGGASDVAYYGGMGMPTIVVVGKNNHQVYYKKLGYSAAENAPIQAAINLALSQSSPTGTTKTIARSSIQIFPSPACDFLQFSALPGLADEMLITDLSGKKVLSRRLETDGKNTTDVRNLPAGLYLVCLKKAGVVVEMQKFLKE